MNYSIINFKKTVLLILIFKLAEIYRIFHYTIHIFSLMNEKKIKIIKTDLFFSFKVRVMVLFSFYDK